MFAQLRARQEAIKDELVNTYENLPERVQMLKGMYYAYEVVLNIQEELEEEANED